MAWSRSTLWNRHPDVQALRFAARSRTLISVVQVRHGKTRVDLAAGRQRARGNFWDIEFGLVGRFILSFFNRVSAQRCGH